MKLLAIVMSTVVFSACGMQDVTSQHKFEIRKKTEKAVYYHAKYTFVLDGYESVATAIKIEVKSNQAAVMWLKDLTRVDNELEKAVLSSTGNSAFSGLSIGEFGGTYTGSLELDSNDKVSGCCSQMTFRPTMDSSLLFVGTKTEVITAAEWDELLDHESTTTTPTTPEVVTLALGTKKIGKLFSITTSAEVRRLEAHNGDDAVVEGALGQWQSTAGEDIFAVQGTRFLFLTNVAGGSANVTQLVGFDADDNRVLEASISVAARDNSITVNAEYFARGDYTWVAFSENPNPDPANPNYIKDSRTNSYLNLNRDNTIHDYHTGFHNFSGRDGRGFWVGMFHFDCPVGNRLMARVGDDIYHGSCNVEDSWWQD